MHRTQRILAVLALAVLVVGLPACSTPSTTAPPSGTSTGGAGSTTGGTTVSLKSLAFDPSTLTVATGATVTFTNDDNVPHRIVVGTDDLGQQQPGESKTWTAPKDGTYTMRCTIHPQMQGQITVGAGGSSVGTPSTGGGSGATTGSGGSGYSY